MNGKIIKVFKILGITLITIIVFVLILRGVFNSKVTKKVDSKIEKLKEERPFEIEDFEIKCRLEENGAVSWKKIEKKFSVNDEEKEFIKTAFNKVLDGKPLDTKEKSEIQRIIISNEESFRFFQEVINKPCFKYADNWDDLALKLKIPKITTMLVFMRLYGLNAFLMAEEGNLEDAIEQCCSGLTFTLNLLNEPFLINYLIASAIYRDYIELLNRIVSSEEIDNENLSRILRKLDSNIWREKFILSLKAERAFYLDTWSELLKGNKEVIEELDMPPKIFLWLLEPLFKYDMLYAMKFYSQYIEMCKLPYFKISKDLKYWEKKLENIPFYYILSRFLIPNFDTAYIREEITKAVILTAKAGIACKIYYNNYGRFPERLSELVPEILSEVPEDPFTGEPLIYRKTLAGFIVYSVGVNQKDDGGKETRELIRIMLEKDDDWSWYEGRITQ
ncbi:hypothetical protein NLC82_03475 [Candidatus Aminicenantes bacterium AC-335-A11]|jgi:hypothetical protein|nr:hypothetical protein [SCandidatus Aminicenantes bacterium Aminicenantia_JdfR_composite]MCP2597778.1 hypothetical protein [Candidatus Aminicenantes bacterium AC-335-L06]MCP2605869.1 hypothetical protein [Candidatus Aminicenantes bacterium AC-335-O07]MCP2618459.1 hypothetical protein [Candidatus Aminicenantes bacterium AC-335-A11]MCP2620503.1 hypothetical protein [Candidatus Aminicenantes bacterium AC-334-E05]